jgi:hypothetical protein
MIRSAEQLEHSLNADLPNWLDPGSPSLWQAMNDKLSYFRERPEFRFTVSPWKSLRIPRSHYMTIIVAWNDTEMEVQLPKEFILEDPERYKTKYGRAFVAATAMTFATRHAEVSSGQVSIALCDEGEQGALSFCGNHPDAILIPDYRFLQTLGYQEFRASVNRDWIPWSQRKPVVFWRSSAIGCMFEPHDGDDWSWLPRVHLCDMAAGLAQQYPIDARITGIDPYIQETYPEYVPAIEQFSGAFVAPLDFMGYRYLIDIDGSANAYAGYFQKLLTGSTVLKVASPRGLRQWYYDRLQPWVHYIPVAADLSNLESAIDFVLTHDREAYAIGQRGREVALAMTLESEMAHMAVTVAAVQGALEPAPRHRRSIRSYRISGSSLYTAEYGVDAGAFWVLLVDPALGQPITFEHSVVITATQDNGSVFTASAANISLEPGTYDIHVWAFLERSGGSARQTSSELKFTFSGITID